MTSPDASHTATPASTATDPPAAEPTGMPVETITLSYGPRNDPFQATLTAAAGGAGVSIPLTPVVLADLLTDLHAVEHDQRHLMGLPTSSSRDDHGPADQDDPAALDRGDQGAGTVLRRASDPLGLRQLRQRPRATLILAALIAASLLIALIVQVIQR